MGPLRFVLWGVYNCGECFCGGVLASLGERTHHGDCGEWVVLGP